MESFSSSVNSIEGYLHALVIVDAATKYRWVCGMKNKDDSLIVVSKWYCDIADLGPNTDWLDQCETMLPSINLKK